VAPSETSGDPSSGSGSPTGADAASAADSDGSERRGLERRQLDELRRRLDDLAPQAEELADYLPQAIALRAARDHKLAIALARTVEAALAESVRRNPQEIAAAIHPVLGPAIRKAMTESMSGLVGGINRTIEHSISPRGLRWRFEAWRTGVPFAQVVLKHSLVYRVEQVFLIHGETGLLLSHVPDDGIKDGSVISGMLTAIRDFVADSFEPRDTGEVRRFSVGDVNLLTETGPRAYLAAVVRGVPPDSLNVRLERTLERIHLDWSTALATFNGDPAPFDEVRPLLADCLQTVLSSDRPRPRSRAVRSVRFAAVGALLIVLGAWLVQSQRMWTRAQAVLEQAPGIVLTSADRGGGQWQFTGWRDPLAAEPAALLAAIGADTTAIEARWEPYVSIEPPLVLERAIHRLAPPAGVTVALAGDTLVLAGRASAAWRDAAVATSRSLPGVEHLNVSELAVAESDP
jgi:OOP family OmpA-OmpF porin